MTNERLAEIVEELVEDIEHESQEDDIDYQQMKTVHVIDGVPWVVQVTSGFTEYVPAKQIFRED